MLLLLFPAIPLETGDVEILVEVEELALLAVVLGCTVTTVVPASVVSSADVLDDGVDALLPDEPAELDEPVDPVPLLDPAPLPLGVELLVEPVSAVPSPPDRIRPVPHGIADPSGCVCCGGSTCDNNKAGSQHRVQ